MNTAAWILLSYLGLSTGQSSLVFLGPGEGSQQPEIVSLPLGEAAPCGLQLRPYPVRVEGGVAFLLAGEVVTVCGGDSLACLSLHPFLGTWEEVVRPLPYFIGGAQAISLQNGDIMILGGYNDEGVLSSTLIFHQAPGARWKEGPRMPTPRAEFCAVQLNTTHTLIVGGGNIDQFPSSNVLMFDGVTFQQVSGLLEPRADMGCTLSHDGHVIVAGGMGPRVDGGDPDGEPMASVEIYHPETDTWTPGPPLPKPMGFFAGMVTDGEKVLLLGGFASGGGYTTDIHSLVPGAEGWVLEETHLMEHRGYSPALTVPLDSLDC